MKPRSRAACRSSAPYSEPRIPACTDAVVSSRPSSAARLNVVPWKYGWPKYCSHVSPCESSCTSASGPWRFASARSSASVIEWSPPIAATKTPASTTGASASSIWPYVLSVSPGETGTSP